MDNSKKLLRVVCALGLVGLLQAGCSDDEDNGNGNGNSDASVRGDAGLDGGNNTADSSVDAAVRLTEAQVVGVAAAVNTGEIQAGMLAQTKATTQSARDFASMMVTMHTAAQARQTALGIAPAPSEPQMTVVSMANTALTTLQNTPAGLAFDEAYLASQIKMHADTRDMIDLVLLPSATTQALKDELTRTRGEVVTHLNDATQRRSTLGDAGVPSGDAGANSGMDAGT